MQKILHKYAKMCGTCATPAHKQLAIYGYSARAYDCRQARKYAVFCLFSCDLARFLRLCGKMYHHTNKRA
jgi:hypothetical protein